MNKKECSAAADLCEDLLTSWLCLTASVRNERLVRSMTFREVFICNILFHAETDQLEEITATTIVQRTGILKSQVNKILEDMEREGLIMRVRSPKDKRFVFLHLTDLGKEKYQEEHKHILRIMEHLLAELGDDEAKALIPELNHAAAIMKKLSFEK